jgi:hypothetical protein
LALVGIRRSRWRGYLIATVPIDIAQSALYFPLKADSANWKQISLRFALSE